MRINKIYQNTYYIKQKYSIDAERRKKKKKHLRNINVYEFMVGVINYFERILTTYVFKY